MAERVMRGVPAAPGTAVGAARLLAVAEAAWVTLPPDERAAELETALQALDAAAAELDAIAARLRDEGRSAEAEVVETGVLMAGDPSLRKEVSAAVEKRGRPAAAAILKATGAHAAAIAELEDPLLSARAADVLSLGNRAARLASGSSPGLAVPNGPAVLVASDLGPADVAELGPEVVAIALREGAVRAHAAIVARSLGLPMVVAVGKELLSIDDGETLLVDGTDGVVIASPARAKLESAQASAARRAETLERSRERRELAAETVDGRRLSVLANVASGAEVSLALAAGAEGAGLIRTELAFLDAADWPSEAEHRAALEPVLAPLAGRVATVRVLDFGGDKTPPFIAGTRARGIELLLAEPTHLEDQLRGILAAAQGVELRVLPPMVRNRDDVARVRDALGRLGSQPAVGAMIETPEAAADAAAIAEVSDFVSIGTNDLAATVLGVERFASGEALVYHPAVLRAIEAVALAAAQAGVPLEVCGEAASDPVTVPLLAGLGVDELSVGAARVGIVREWIRSLSYVDSRGLASRSVRATSALEVSAITRGAARSLELLESGDTVGEDVHGGGGVIAIGPQP